MKKLFFSIIIPSSGRTESLKKCLQLLRPDIQSFNEAAYEIIVSDDKFSQNTKTELAASIPEVNYIAGPGRGPASNRNSAAAAAKGMFLIFIDDDCLPEKTLINSYYEACNQYKELKVFEGRVFADRPQESLDETSPINETGGRLWSCNFAVEKELFLSMKGFDERFRFAAMEDVELQKRLLDKGEIIKFIPKAAVCHPWRKKQAKDFKNHEVSTMLYLRLHPDEKKRINSRYYLYLAAYGMFKFVLPKIIRGKTRGIKLQILEYFYFLKMAFLLAFSDLAAGSIK